jgi:PAS domain S-box-containing protein
MGSEKTSDDGGVRELVERERGLREQLVADNARLRRALQRPRSPKMHRNRFLLRLSDALRPLADPFDVQATACRLLAEYLQVDRTYYREVHEDRGVTVVCRDYFRPGLTSLVGEYPHDDFSEAAAVLQSGQPLVVDSVEHSTRFSETARASYRSLGFRAFICAPLLKGGRFVGTLSVVNGSDREWSDDDVSLVHEVAERTWDARERARSVDDLRRSEEKYRRVFNSIAEGLVVVEMIYDDRGKPVDYRFLEANPALERMTGLHDVVGKTVREVNPAVENAWIEVVDRVTRTGESVRFEEYSRRSRRWYTVHASRIGGDGSRLLTLIFDDITERKEAELQLAFQADLLANVNDPMAAADENLVFTYWNKAAERLFGWTSAEIIGRSPGTVFGSVYPGSSRDAVLAALMSDGHYDGESIVHRKDGTPVWVELHAAALRGPLGEFRGLVTSRRDITERKKAEQELAFRADLLANVHDALTATDENFVITYWNKAAERLYGWTAGEAIGHTTAEILEARFPNSSREAVLATLLRDNQLESEFINRRKDGSEVVVEVRLTALRDGNGAFRGMIVSHRDISERKRLEEQREQLHADVEEARNHLQTVVEHVPAGVAVWRAPDLRCELANPAYRAIAPEKDFVGKTFAEVWPEVEDEDRQKLQRVLDTGVPYQGEDRRWQICRSPGGPLEEAYFSFIWVRLPPDASGYGAIACFVVETTEHVRARQRVESLAAEARQQAAELVVVNEKLEQINAELIEAVRAAEDAVEQRNQFLAVAAHELKTPITSLRGFAELLRRQYETRGVVDPEHLNRALRVIDQQSSKLTRLVTQLLDTSRLEAGRLVLERRHVDLVPLIERVVAAAGPSSSRHTIELRSSPRAPVFADARRVEQLLMNLLDNAIRFSPEGGLVEVTVTTSPTEVTIAVRDHGMGVPPEHRERIFDRFYRANEDKSIAGLGLGLYVSREIVARHGGRIDVESPSDGGTLFVVCLPTDANGSDQSHSGDHWPSIRPI